MGLGNVRVGLGLGNDPKGVGNGRVGFRLWHYLGDVILTEIDLGL